MAMYDPPGSGPGDGAARVVRRVAIAVIAVSAVLIVFAGGVVAARVLGVASVPTASSAGMGTADTPTPGPPEPAPSAVPDPSTSASPDPATSATSAAPDPPTQAPTEPPATLVPAGDTGTAEPPRCHTGDLRVALSAAEGAAGSEYHWLSFTNVSDHTCRMDGFPGLAPVAADGTWIADVATVRTDARAALVTLSRGATAWALLRWSRVDGPYTGAACTPGAKGLAVTPPDETTQARLTPAGGVTICGYGTITTGPVLAARTA
jgi:hypothetical protein